MITSMAAGSAQLELVPDVAAVEFVLAGAVVGAILAVVAEDTGWM